MPQPIEAAPPLPRWLRRELPFRRRRVRIFGRRVCYLDHGPEDAPVALLVHGNPTWSFLWRKVIRALDGAPVRVIAPDLLGFGGSDKPRRADEHHVSLHVDHVTGLLERLDARSFVAVGQDWGGPVACGVARRLQARLHGLVIGNTAVVKPRRPFRLTRFHKLSQAPGVSDALFRGLLFPVPVLDRAQGERASLGWRDKAAYAWPLRRLADRAGPLGLARMVPTSEAHPSTAVLDRIGEFVESYQGPAAIVWGHRDPILGRGLRRHTEALPQASVRESQAGHFSQEEVPELWAEAIREVAAAAPAATGSR